MKNVSNKERISLDVMAGGKFSLDTMAGAISDGLIDGMEMTEPMELFAEVNTDFDYDEFRNFLEAEMEKIDQAMQQLEQKRSLIDGWWKGIDHYRDALDKAYEKIRMQENKIENLRQQLAKEQRLREKREMISIRLAEITKEDADLKVELATQRELYESASRQLAEEKRQRADLEMNLAETRKLMDSIAKKSSEEGVQKAIHTFVNYSKRKTSDKRTYIKNTILEFTSVNRISLPEELSATIDCLDDEQTEPKNVTMNGGVYNDIHDNKGVNYNSNI